MTLLTTRAYAVYQQEIEVLDALAEEKPPSAIVPEPSAPPKRTGFPGKGSAVFLMGDETKFNSSIVDKLDNPKPSLKPTAPRVKDMAFFDLDQEMEEFVFEVAIEEPAEVEQRYNHVPGFVNDFQVFSDTINWTPSCSTHAPDEKQKIAFSKSWLESFCETNPASQDTRFPSQPKKTDTSCIKLPQQSPKNLVQSNNSKPLPYASLRLPPLSKPRATRVLWFRSNKCFMHGRAAVEKVKRCIIDFSKYHELINELAISDTEDENDLAREESMIVIEVFKDGQLCFAGKTELVDQMFKSAVLKEINYARLHALLDKKKHLLIGKVTIKLLLERLFELVHRKASLKEDFFYLAQKFVDAGFLDALGPYDHNYLLFAFENQRLMEIILSADSSIFQKTTIPTCLDSIVSRKDFALAKMYIMLGVNPNEAGSSAMNLLDKTLLLNKDCLFWDGKMAPIKYLGSFEAYRSHCNQVKAFIRLLEERALRSTLKFSNQTEYSLREGRASLSGGIYCDNELFLSFLDRNYPIEK